MPNRRNKKSRNNKNGAEQYFLYNMDIELEEGQINLFKKYADDLIDAHNEKFGNCDLDGKSDDEKIEQLKQRYIFYHNYFPLCMSMDDCLGVAKNNYLCMSIKMIRDVAKRNNIENELSRCITDCAILPMDIILKKHGKHRFQYCDEMDLLQDLHAQLNGDPRMLHVIHPKLLIHDYSKYGEIKPILIDASSIMNNPADHRKLLAYFSKFDALFPASISSDLENYFMKNVKRN